MKKKILVIDDDEDFLKAVKNLLDSEGYSVKTKNNGKDGYETAKKDNPDLILLDVMMPKIEGFDVARQLHDNPETKNLKVIIITGIRKQMNLSFGFEPDETWLPVMSVLEKPVKPQYLLEKIKEALK